MYQSTKSWVQRVFNVDAQYLMSGGFWLLVAQGVTLITSLAAAVFFANTLSENDYGIYRYLIGLSVLLSAFSLTGISQAIMQAAARGYGNFFYESTPATLKFGTLLSFASLIGAGYYFVNENTVLASGCILVAAFQPFAQLFQNAQATFYGQTKFVTGSILQILKSTFVSGTSILSLLLTHNLVVLLATYFASQALTALVSYLYTKRQTERSMFVETPPEETERGLSYAKNTSIRNVLVHVSNQLDSIFVFQHLGAAQLALYSIATLIPGQIRGGFKNLQTLLIPKYSKHDSLSTLRKYIPKRSFQFFIVLCSFSLLFIAITPALYEVLFPGYPDAIFYTQLLALSFPASISLIPFGAMQALRMERELYHFQVSTSILQLILTILLIIFAGILGAVISRIVGQYARTFIAYFLLFKKF